MATLFITELNSVDGRERGTAPLTVSISGTSAQSAALGYATHGVIITSDVDCYIAFGDNPTATTSNEPLYAEQKIYRAVSPGQKIAVRS